MSNATHDRREYERQYRADHPSTVWIWRYRAAVRLVKRMEQEQPELAAMRASILAGGEPA